VAQSQRISGRDIPLSAQRSRHFLKEIAVSMTPKPEGATTVFVLGLLSLIICAPLGIAAWIQGNNYLGRCRSMNVEPDGLAVAADPGHHRYLPLRPGARHLAVGHVCRRCRRHGRTLI
jgi:hypothetical protein